MNKAETTLAILSGLKKNIVLKQKDRESMMIEFLSIKRKIMGLDQDIGRLQRKMLENIP